MALTKLTEDLDIISKLSDEPNDSDGLTAAQLKAKFDEAGNKIKTYLNSVLTEELQAEGGAANVGIDYIEAISTAQTVQDALAALATMAQQSAQGVVSDGSITTPKLANGAVTKPKLAENSVGTANLENGAVTNAKTDFTAGFAPAGPLVLTSGVHYFASASELPSAAVTGQLAFVKV